MTSIQSDPVSGVKSLLNRRDFLSTSIATSAMAIAFLPMARAMAAEPTTGVGWDDIPGFGGTLKRKMLWNETGGDGKCYLLRAEMEAIIPGHSHPAGEFIFVVDGSFEITQSNDVMPRVYQTTAYNAGDSIWIVPGAVHKSEITTTGATVLVFTPKDSNYRAAL